MGYVPNTADVIANILQGSANVESIIRTNSLDQLTAPAADLTMNSKRLTTLAQGIVAGDGSQVGQSAAAQVGYPFVVSGCFWTADSPGSSLNASMTSGTVMIKGVLLTVASISAHAFTASSETYVDFQDNGDGTAHVFFTTVGNNTTSPALANSGTVLNTIRNAVISTSASLAAAGIGQGGAVTLAGAFGSTTVAAGSNGANITATPLNVASSASFPSGGGFAQVAHSGGQTYLIQFTGTGTGTLTGVTVISGSGTVSTGDTVSGCLPPLGGSGGQGFTDSIGNLIYNTVPFPKVIGQQVFANALSTSLTATSPIPGPTNNPFVAPFVVPPGPVRKVKIGMATPLWTSSAAVGTSVTLATNSDNNVTPFGTMAQKVAVASDGAGTNFAAARPLTAGTYYAQAFSQQGAAGTMTLSATFFVTYLTVEYA